METIKVTLEIPTKQFENLIIKVLEQKIKDLEMPEKEFYNSLETALLLGVKVGTVYNLGSSGQLKKSFVGNKPVYFKKDIANYRKTTFDF